LKGNDRLSSNEEEVVTFDGIAILTPRWEMWTIHVLETQVDIFILIFCVLSPKSNRSLNMQRKIWC
jgi:hypothetical protein